jgi:DNA-binding NtrC family response regulator
MADAGTSAPTVFIVDADRSAGSDLSALLASHARVRIFTSVQKIGPGVDPPDVVVTGLTEPLRTALETLRAVRALYSACAGVLVADYAEFMGLDGSQRTRDSFLLACRPVDPSTLIKNIERAAATARMRAQLKTMQQATRGVGGGRQP